MRDFVEVFCRLKGQPAEIITGSGFKFCGIIVEASDCQIVLIDDKGRPVHIQTDHIDAMFESQKKLDRVCGEDDCRCDDDDDKKKNEHDRKCGCE